MAAAALLAVLPVGLGHDLPRREHDEEPPDAVAVGELRKPAAGRAGIQAVKRTQGRIFLVTDGVGARVVLTGNYDNEPCELAAAPTAEAGAIAVSRHRLIQIMPLIGDLITEDCESFAVLLQEANG
jgi:hypothetical protein